MHSHHWLRFLDERDRDLMEEADAEYAMNDAEFQRWILRQWDSAVGYDEPDDAFDQNDLGDRLEIEGGRL